MSKRKVAPVLQELLHEPVKGVPMLAAYHGREAVKELRALLAVARAADRVPHMDICPASGFDAPDGPGDPCTCTHKRALARLARLDRVSKGEK